MRLYTSRYSNREGILASGCVPVGITLGAPKFPLGYQLGATLKLLAPSGAIFKLPKDAFQRGYYQGLDRVGVGTIYDVLLGISAANGERDLVLLCYENLSDPAKWCHRSMFVQWWLAKTGEIVEELPDPAALKRPPPRPGATPLRLL
jgi:hypothetical protein